MTELTKHEPTTIYIKPSKGLAALNLRDLWIYRELVFFMVWRDVKVKYKQTLLGMAWAVIQPVMTMLIFTFLFGKVVKLPTDGIPYVFRSQPCCRGALRYCAQSRKSFACGAQ